MPRSPGPTPAATLEVLQMGVEEEFLLADPASRFCVPRAADVVAEAARVLGDAVGCEFFATQLEVHTEPHRATAGLRAQLGHGRLASARAAARLGCLLIASRARS